MLLKIRKNDWKKRDQLAWLTNTFGQIFFVNTYKTGQIGSVGPLCLVTET